MRMLVPDGQKEHRNETFYALPIDTELWMRLRQFHLNTTRNGGEFIWMRNVNKNHNVIIVFQGSDISDEQAMETAAWIRFESQAQDTIYIVPHSRSIDSITSIVTRSMGVHRDRVVALDTYAPGPIEWMNKA